MTSKEIITICLLGAESTGKTTLAQALAKHYKTVWIPEYGRIYAEGKVYLPTYSEWEGHEFVDIAEGQIRLTEQLKPRACKYIFQDTDALATSVWHQRYTNSKSTTVEKLALSNLANLYLLTAPDVPFVQDGTRDGELVRNWMHEEFINVLTQIQVDYFIISGPYEGRKKQALTYLNKWLNKKENK